MAVIKKKKKKKKKNFVELVSSNQWVMDDDWAALGNK